MNKPILLIFDGSGSSKSYFPSYLEYARNLVDEGFVGLVVIAENNNAAIMEGRGWFVVHTLDENGIAALKPSFGPGNEGDVPKIVANYPYLTSVYVGDCVMPDELFKAIKMVCITVNVINQTIHHTVGPDGDNDLLVEALAKLLPCPALPAHG